MIYQKEMEINIMAIDATFWVAISFVIFFGGLVYLKIPQKINEILNKLISDIKNEIDESEKLRAEAKIFAKLFPTRITDNKLSGLERSFKALAEFFSPDFALFLNLILFDAIIPVSDPEKKADKSNKNIIDVIKINKEGSSDI